LKNYGEELKKYGTFFDALPIEIHGKTHSNQQFYLIAIENNFILAFSSGKGRLGSLFRSFRELLWDLDIQGSQRTTLNIPTFITHYEDKSDGLKDNQFLNLSFDILTNYSPIISNASLLRCACDLSRIESVRLSDSNAGKKHAIICAIFSNIHEVCERLFRTSLLELVFSQHGFNSIVLKWAVSSSKETALFMVGDSIRGVGLLKLVGDQILEHKIESGPPLNEVRLKPVSE
jgi:hypothetical protein